MNETTRNKIYDFFKFIAQIVLPAIATFYVTIAEIWSLPLGDEVSRTIMAVDTLLGAILMITSANYHKQKRIENTIEKEEE